MHMARLSISEAVKIIPVSESTLRRNLKSGKVSFTTDKQGKKQVDVSELERFYGQLTITDNQKNGNDTDKIVILLEEQVSDLKSQLTAEKAEKMKLLELADRLQKQNELLMLPKPKTKRSLLSFLRFSKA